MDVKFISQDNEVQKLYAKFGMVVPVGDLSTGKAPAIQPLPSTSTQTSVTAQFNVMSGADITYLSYEVWGPEGSGDEPIAYDELTPQKGVITVTVDNLEYNSGPYQVIVQAANETGDTTATTTIALQHYTNWATPDEVLLGNKYIGEDGQEHTGEYECPTCPEPVLETVPVTPTTSAQTITPSTGYDGIGTVNVSAVTSAIDANITAGNIKNGVTILGVTGTMTGGPTDGGAVVTSATLIDDGGYEIHVVFSTMPALDSVNHRYTGMLLAYCDGNYGSVFDGIMCYQNLSREVSSFNIDHGNSEISFFDVTSPTDSSGNELSEANGYILIFEDGYDNLKYKIPCTIVNTTIV